MSRPSCRGQGNKQKVNRGGIQAYHKAFWKLDDLGKLQPQELHGQAPDDAAVAEKTEAPATDGGKDREGKHLYDVAARQSSSHLFICFEGRGEVD